MLHSALPYEEHASSIRFNLPVSANTRTTLASRQGRRGGVWRATVLCLGLREHHHPRHSHG